MRPNVDDHRPADRDDAGLHRPLRRLIRCAAPAVKERTDCPLALCASEAPLETRLGRLPGLARCRVEQRHRSKHVEDGARLAAFRELAYRLRTEAGLTQAELAERKGTTRSATARLEGGNTRSSLETLERVATAVGAELIAGVGTGLSTDHQIVKLAREGHAVVRPTS